MARPQQAQTLSVQKVDIITFQMNLEPVTDEWGTTTWFDSDGKRHRDGDLPAVVYAEGGQGWYQHGKLHRDGDLPAVVEAEGAQGWFQHGVIHRDGDLPAMVGLDGLQWWFWRGRRHRSFDLPAVVKPNGDKEWWVDGRFQSSLDRELTRAVMTQAARWSPLRAAFVGAVICKFVQMHC